MFNYSLRYLEKKDLSLVLKWRNSKHIRKYMYEDNIITDSEHKGWFNKLIKNNNSVYYILEYKKAPIGIVNFYEIDKVNNKCKWGFYIGDQDVPKGSGLILGYLGLEQAFDFLKIRKIIGEAFDFNIPSVNFHRKLGFKEEGRYTKHILKNGKYEDVTSFAIFKDDWVNNKGKIKEMIDSKIKENSK